MACALPGTHKGPKAYEIGRKAFVSNVQYYKSYVPF
jgi:hypothetical protein